MMSTGDTALEFVRRINTHDPEAIAGLMTDDHRFIDASGNTVAGKEKMKTGWAAYFDRFPDYTIGVDSTIVGEGAVALFGSASGTFRGETAAEAHWHLPAAWRTVVENGRIGLWQVYADTKLPSEILQRYAPHAEEPAMVTGLGGVFIKARDPKVLARWYDAHLGTSFGEHAYHAFPWLERHRPERIGQTALSILPESAGNFSPSEKPFMLNFRVRNLNALLDELRASGVRVEEKTESYDYGTFGWIIDPEGNKIELWEPIDEVWERMP